MPLDLTLLPTLTWIEQSTTERSAPSLEALADQLSRGGATCSSEAAGRILLREVVRLIRDERKEP